MKEKDLVDFLTKKTSYCRKMERIDGKCDDQASAYWQGQVDLIEEVIKIIEKANELEKAMRVDL